MRGDIWVEDSEPEKGSTFVFYIPAMTVSGQLNKESAKSKESGSRRLRVSRPDEHLGQRIPLRILVAEDNA
jgi:hypothetical protein